MASFGHVLVGIAASRFVRRDKETVWSPFSAAVVWSGLSLLPDLDVFGFRFGIHYEDPWGHRGATHSLVFALACTLVVNLLARGMAWSIAREGGSRAAFAVRRITLTAWVVITSHALLDTLTDGGLGCALLWPFSNQRFFAPWTPLPVAPLGRAFLSAEGLRVATIELGLLLPFVIVFFLWQRRSPKRPSPP